MFFAVPPRDLRLTPAHAPARFGHLVQTGGCLSGNFEHAAQFGQISAVCFRLLLLKSGRGKLYANSHFPGHPAPKAMLAKGFLNQ